MLNGGRLFFSRTVYTSVGSLCLFNVVLVLVLVLILVTSSRVVELAADKKLLD